MLSLPGAKWKAVRLDGCNHNSPAIFNSDALMWELELVCWRDGGRTKQLLWLGSTSDMVCAI
ncbi:hypothetical protein DIPPA_25001 [Diplonema papillatum]|nr:hypothetical protein DIPPA_31822 [Diplonema papillatum]KAJ9469479.1 hypothetical protein DIPPA_25001 [Diplonema papillatum]